MSKVINLLAIGGAAAITGYFIYKVILPQLKDFQWPTWQFPDFSQMQQPQQPSQYGSQPQQQQPVEPTDSSQPSNNTIPEPTAPPSAGGHGMTIGFKTTGQKVAMNVGGDPAGTGQRYNANHKFTNYLMSGLFKLGSNQELIEMKTDGPNHGGCSQVPRCFWAEPRFDMSGKSSLSMEMPHTPRKDYTISCPSCKSIPGSYGGKWIGYAVAAYGPKGGRVVEQWVDPTGTGNSWQLTLREKIDGRWHGAQNRDLPLDGRGLEAEIRMIGSSGGTDMRNAFIYEIVPAGGTTTNQYLNLRFSNPYLYNSFYNRRRL